MINQLKEFDFFKARDILTTELETPGVIGKLILKDFRKFDNLVRIMCREIEIALNDNSDEDSALISIEMFKMLQYVAYKLPIYMLSHPEYYWTDFNSSFVLIYENYLDVQMQLLNLIKQDMPEDEYNENYKLVENDVKKLQEEVFPALNNLHTFGVTLKDLVMIAQNITIELQELRMARPVSMQLSEAYLAALNL